MASGIHRTLQVEGEREMRNILKLSHLLLAGILAMYAMPSALFAYSYIVRDFKDQIPAPGPDPTYKNTHTPKNWRLAIPSGVTTIKGILMIGTPNCQDTRDWYKKPFY